MKTTIRQEESLYCGHFDRDRSAGETYTEYDAVETEHTDPHPVVYLSVCWHRGIQSEADARDLERKIRAAIEPIIAAHRPSVRYERQGEHLVEVSA